MEYAGRTYYIAGKLNGVTPPLGTVLGPNAYGEHVTVIAHEGNSSICGRTQVQDMAAMWDRKNPQSITEFDLIRRFSAENRV